MSGLLHLVRKQLAELSWVLGLCFSMVAILFVLGTYLYRTFGDLTAENLERMPPELIAGAFGGMFAGADPLATWLMTLFVHPLLLTVFSAAAIAITSRGLVREIDRGTLDLLLSAPVSRAQVVLSTWIVLQLSLIGLSLTVWWAMKLGMEIGDIEPPANIVAIRWVVVNLWALFSAVGGVVLLISALSSESGRATAGCISFLVGSFFVNLVASLWRAAQWTEVYSIFHYYLPGRVIGRGEVPPDGLAFLVMLGLVSAGCALWVFNRRDLPAA